MVVTLKTSDNQIVTVSDEIAKLSNVLKEMMDEMDDDSDEIPVMIRKELIDAFVEFAKLHLNDKVGDIPKPIPTGKPFKDIPGIPEWSETMLNPLSYQQLQVLILTANYLDVQPWLNLLASYIAFKIKGMTGDQIKQIFSEVEKSNPTLK